MFVDAFGQPWDGRSRSPGDEEMSESQSPPGGTPVPLAPEPVPVVPTTPIPPGQHDDTITRAGSTTEEDAGGDHSLWDVAIDAVAAGATYAEAGAVIGRSGRQTRRVLTRPENRRKVHERRLERAARITGLANAALDRAIDVLVEALDAQSMSDRLRAARQLLELGTKLTTRVHYEELIRELEARLADSPDADDGQDPR
jgi:hypothetical protein